MLNNINFTDKQSGRKILRKGPQKLTEQEIELAMRTTKASLAFEGFYLTDENEDIGRKILKGEMTGDEAVDYYLAKRGLKRHD
ncbi:hypothetical protein FACS1894188_09070 [Clostridia bacterium]|nr:hypothetical protein FACS1894188_09070 [Clostridia bacterium]